MKKTILSFIALFFTITIAFAQPANDTCAGAIDLSNVLTDVGTVDCQTVTAGSTPVTTLPASTDGATDSTPGMDTGTGCSSQGADYWYSWTATTTGLYWQYHSLGGDPGIYVYSGTCGGLTVVDCLNTFSSGTLSGWNIGDNLIIQIHDFGTTTGIDLSFCMNAVNVGCTDPTALNYDATATLDDGSCYFIANDVCSGATPWPAAITATSCTDGSGLVNLDFGPYGNPFGETNACDGWFGDAIAWYSYTVPVLTAPGFPYYDLIWDDGDGQTNNCGIGLEVYDACGGASIGCINNVSGTVSGLLQGNTYYLAVWDDGSGGASCDFCLSLAPAPTCPACDPTAVVADADVSICVGEPATLNATLGNVNTGPFIDYTVTEPGSCAITGAGTPTVLALGDDAGSGAIPLPFVFNFFGVDYSNIYVSSNGYVTFSSVDQTDLSEDAVPSTITPNAYISLLWDDLNPNSGGTISHYTASMGAANCFVVDYNAVSHFGGGQTVTGQIIICDDGSININCIDCQSDAVGQQFNGMSIENESGTAGYFPAASTNGLYSGVTSLVGCVSYTPSYGADFPCTFVGWATDATNWQTTIVSTNQTEMVSPTTTTTYHAVAVCPCGIGVVCTDDQVVTVNAAQAPFITLDETCLTGTIGQCSYGLLGANPGDIVTAQSMAATQNEFDGYPAGNMFNIDVTDANGCTATFSVEKPECNCNSSFELNFMASDPCVCNNDQSANGAGDGTFSETVVVTGTCGFMLIADAPGQAIDGMPFIEGPMDPVTGLCDYTLSFNHTDLVGYSLCVTDVFGNPITGSGSGMQICISNVCEYPVINEPTLGPFCADAAPTTDLDLLVMEDDGDPGDVTVSVDGTTTTTFDPAALGAGPHTILWTFTGSGTGNSGGSVMNPAYPGCTTSYETTVTVNPVPELTVSDCICDFDPNIGNIGSQVTLSVANGTAPYTVSVSTGTITNTTLVDNQVATLYLGVTGGNYTIDVVDANGCTTSYSSSCEPCDFNIAISDPCSCNNDQDYNGAQNGTFAERIDIQGPPGLNLIIGAGSTGLIGFNVGDPIPEVIPGLYRLSFDHVDITGYTLFVEGTNGGGTFPINDPNGDQLVASNACQYPVITEPDLDILDFCNNGTPLMFDGTEVTEINGFAGVVRVFVNGQSISEFDPTQYANGFYVLRFEFTGTFVDNISTGGVPAFPGCTTNTFIQVGVGGGGQLTCNDHVNISVNNDCEVDFSWSTLLEDDYIPDVFDAVFTDSAGNVIDEADLGSYAGSTLTYSIVDMCNGNSCWGTMQIDDKTAPSIVDCDCPVGGETGVGDYAEECTLNCWELPLLKEKYWDRLRDNLVPEMADDFLDDYVYSTCDDVTEDQISYYDVYIDLGPCSGTLLRRTWTVTYDKGNDVSGSVSCTREYYFQPIGIETLIEARRDPATGLFEVIEDTLLLPPRLVELTCGADISPAGIAAYFDNPGSTDNDTDDNRIDPDELDIDVVIENNEGVPYAYPHYYIEGRNPSGPHAQPIDNEVCNIIVAYTDQEIEACAAGCSGNRKVLRTWTVLDWCNGQFVEHEQVIKSIDTGAPSLVVHDVSASVDPWKCAADVALPHPEHIYDDCETITAYSIGTVEGALSVSGNYADGYVIHDVPNGETITVEYLVEDCCGNIGRAFVDVSVVDLTPPVPVTKEFIVLSLSNIGNPVDENQGVAKLYAEDVDNGSYDGCTGVDISVRRTDVVCPGSTTDWADFVKFCCEDLDGQAFVEIDVEFRVVDAYGNTNYAWSTVRLEDKSNTTQTCPPDMILTCDMDWNDFTMTGLPQAFSACGEIDLMCDVNELIEDTEARRKGPNDGFFNDPRYDGVEVPAYDPSCGYGAVRRQFKSCSSCTQWFVIEPIDAFNPNTISFPGDIVVDCDAWDTGEPDWEPATCNLVGVSLESDTFLFEDGACYKILNHWSVINWCTYDPTDPMSGGKYEHTQVIKIIDTQDPVMTAADSLCFSVDVDCVSTAVELSASGNDEGNCGSEWLKWEVTIDLNSDWTSDMYFGTDLPRIVNGVDNPYYIAPTGNDQLATITLPAGLASSKAWHRAVWRVYDGCGNNVSSVRYFQITDKKAPTPYCLNLSTAVMSSTGDVELWAIDFNVGSFDNCTDSDNLLFTFTDVAPPGRDDTEYDSSSDLEWYNGTFWYFDSETGEYQDQDDYGDEVHRWEPGLRSAGKVFTAADADASGFAQIPIYVWDECGNNDFCLVNLRIIDNMGVGEGRIAGQIMTEEGEEVEGVMTELMSDSPEYPLYNMTDANGEYSFNEIPMSIDYAVTAGKNDDYLNGVSTLDLLLIQRHILGQEQLSSAYKMIAADVNNDKDISTVDMIELRKLILGVYDELPLNASWKAVDASQTLTTANPWIYKESLNINDLQTQKEGEDFIGVKIGDVNASAQANFKANIAERSSNVLELLYADGQVEAGEVVEVVMTSGDDELYGYQFTMDLKGMELVEIRGSDITEGNVAVFEDKMTMSYNSLEAMNKEGEIFTMVLKATQSGQVSDMIGINSGITKAEAYLGESLEVVNLDMRNVEGEGKFALYQNQPNPFTEYTVIGYEIPTSGEVKISLYDVTGRVLSVIEKESVKGYNEVRVNRSDLGTSGMIYYKLESKEHTATQHMMLIE